MEQLLKTRAGKIKGIGVSNFSVKTLTELLKHAEIVPAMNQIETHPYNQDRDLVRLCQEKGIVVTAYSPLGMALSPMPEDRDIVSVAQATGVTPEQIILSWNVQRHVVVIPKSLNPVHIEQNMKMVKLNEEHRKSTLLPMIQNAATDASVRHTTLKQTHWRGGLMNSSVGRDHRVLILSYKHQHKTRLPQYAAPRANRCVLSHPTKSHAHCYVQLVVCVVVLVVLYHLGWKVVCV